MEKSKLYQAINESLKKKTTQIAIVAAILTAIFAAVTAESQVSTINLIQEETIFDPLCVGEHDLEFVKGSFCGKTPPIELMGGSANVAKEENDNNHARILYLKIDISEIPQSFGPFTVITISKADLILKTRYEPAINGTVKQIPFFSINQMCYFTNWSEQTPDEKLPCINDLNMHPTGKFPIFDSLNPEWVDEITFDLKSHIAKAKEKNLDVFTEQIQFYPVIVSNDGGYDQKTRECVESKSDQTLVYSQLDECLEDYRISVYSNEYNSTGVRPQLVLEYSSKPSSITSPLIAVAAAAIPLFSGIIQIQYKAIEERRKKEEARKQKEIDERNQASRNLYGELNDALDGLDADKHRDDSVTIKTKGQNDIFFMSRDLNHDIYDSLKNSGKINFLTYELQQEVQDIFKRIKGHNYYLKRTMEMEDNQEHNNIHPKALKYYQWMAGAENKLLKDIPDMMKKLKSDFDIKSIT